MKYGILILMSVAMVGCSGAKEAYSKGCEAGINEVLGSMGLSPKDEAIKAFCDKAASEAK